MCARSITLHNTDISVKKFKNQQTMIILQNLQISKKAVEPKVTIKIVLHKCKSNLVGALTVVVVSRIALVLTIFTRQFNQDTVNEMIKVRTR